MAKLGNKAINSHRKCAIGKNFLVFCIFVVYEYFIH